MTSALPMDADVVLVCVIDCDEDDNMDGLVYFVGDMVSLILLTFFRDFCLDEGR